jgi:RNA polymerase sigma-70 factor (ECF subfamily)
MHGLSAEITEAGPVGTMPARLRESEVFRPSEDPDAELIKRWQAGDKSAFERLVRTHERNVFRLLYRMLGSREEAEDAAQETFLSLHRHGHRFRRESRFSTFLYRVAANAALNRRRSRGRSRAREVELAQRHAAGALIQAAPRDPEDAAQGAEIQEQVQNALLLLPEELRVAVVLYDIEGRSYKEIAESLEIPEGTVKSRIHRARLGLRERLRELVQSPPRGREAARAPQVARSEPKASEDHRAGEAERSVDPRETGEKP